MANDDFGAQLGSMDRNQLKELMAYLGDASLGQKQVYGAAGEAPGVRGQWGYHGNPFTAGIGTNKAFYTAAGDRSIYHAYRRNKKDKKKAKEFEEQRAKAVEDQGLVNQGRLKSVQQIGRASCRERVCYAV